jgi:membrane-associated phospholipid phosphatase
VWSRESVTPFLFGAAATGGAAFVDDSVRDAVSDPDSSFGDALEWPGEAPATTLPVIVLFAAGRFARGERFRAMTYDLGEAALVSFAYTGLLKVTVRRERPDGSDQYSFPSGHASHAFTLAAVTERHYGWKLGVPMYALAGAVAYSRLVQDKHYLSDVVAGATIGFIVGQAVVRINDRPLEPGPKAAGPTWSVSPLVARDVRGLHVSFSY